MNAALPVDAAVAPTQPAPGAGAAAAASALRVWHEGPQAFSTRRVEPIRHNIHQHPLMQLPALTALAKRLSETKQCRFITPDTAQADEFFHSPQDPQGRAIDEVMRRIEEPGSWLALYNVETDPVYRVFLDEVVDSARALIEPQQRGIFNIGGFIFISAPPSVTPFHIDRENNLWLQVQGRKTINVWDPTDREVVPAPLVDEFIVYSSLDRVRLQEGFRERSHEFDVGPGQGVYFPSTSPHMTRCDPGWTRPGDGVSVSIGVVFYTEATRRAANVHVWNVLMRRLGFTPTLPGISPWRDLLKYPLGSALVKFKKHFRGYKPRKGIEAQPRAPRSRQ